VDVATAPEDHYVGRYFVYEGRRYIKVTTVENAVSLAVWSTTSA
jgi:hypothetical protein